MECLDITLRNQVQWDDCPPRKITHSESTQVWKIPKFVSKFLIPGPCKGEPGLYFAISLSTEMTPALRGPAADDRMLQFQTKWHVTAVLCETCPSAAASLPDVSRGYMHAPGFSCDSTSYASPPWTNSGPQSASIDGHLTPWSDYLWSCRGPEWGQRAFGVGMVTSYSPLQSPATSSMGHMNICHSSTVRYEFLCGI